jgi:hypothetical protein
MKSRHVVGLLVAVALAQAAPIQAYPCLLTTPPVTTFRTETAQANLVVFGQVVPPCRVGDPVELVIKSVIKDHPILDQRPVLKMPPTYTIPDPRNPPCFLVFGDVSPKGELELYRGVPITPAVVPYLKGMLVLKANDDVARLRYCFDFLEHRDSAIAEDALMEFSLSPEPELRRAAARLSPVVLRAWLQKDTTSATKLGLYAFLLGHCGGEEDAALLRRLLEKQVQEVASQVDLILEAYTLLKPREAWPYVLELAKNPKMAFLVRYSALKTARFLAANRPDLVPRREILSVMEMFLGQPDMADLVIEDLRKWTCWDFTPGILALWGQKSHDVPIVRRSILRYALQCPRAEAIRFLAAQRQLDNVELKVVEEQLGLTPPKGGG